MAGARDGLPAKLGVAAAYLLGCTLARVTGVTCLWRTLSGVPCPGCGYTRALWSAAMLRFRDAFALNPMFWSFPILLAYFFLDGKVFRNRAVNAAVIGVVLAGFAALGLGRVVQTIRGVPG